MSIVGRSLKMGIFLCTMSLMVVLGLETAYAQQLFRSSEKGSQSMPAGPVHESVLRQRIVDIQPDAMEGCNAEVLELNFFENVDLLAVRDRVEKGPSGGCAWIGTVIEPEVGQATLVLRKGKLSGSVVMENRLYHVRPFDAGWHLVREIDQRISESGMLMAPLAALPQEQQIVALVNQERSLEDLHPLVEDNRLDNAARGHSEDMASNSYFSHTSQDGRTPWDRIAASEYDLGTGGENIAAGYSTPEAAMNGWMTSSGHRSNILGSSYCDIGVGYGYDGTSAYRHYWTQDFGRERGVYTCSAAATYTITATASAGGKMNPSGRVTMQSTGSQTFSITPDPGFSIADVRVDGTSVGKVTTYTFNGVAANHAIEAKFIQQNTEKPTISLTALDARAVELPANHGRFQVTRTGDQSSSLVVNYRVTGTATPGYDYRTLSGRVTIPASSSTATITVIPYDDPYAENEETVVLTLRTRSRYNVGSPFRARVVIAASD